MADKSQKLQLTHSESRCLGSQKRLTWKLCCATLSRLLSGVQLFATPWTIALQAPLSMGILQARKLEYVAMPTSRGSSQSSDWTQVSHIAGGFFTIWASREASTCLQMPVPVHVSSQPSIVVKENIMVLSQSISLRNPGMPKSCPTSLPYLNTTLLLW